jgi:hypothetical protein
LTPLFQASQFIGVSEAELLASRAQSAAVASSGIPTAEEIFTRNLNMAIFELGQFLKSAAPEKRQEYYDKMKFALDLLDGRSTAGAVINDAPGFAGLRQTGKGPQSLLARLVSCKDCAAIIVDTPKKRN